MDVVENLKATVENLNAEKIALDQLYVESIKNSLQLRKELILTQIQLQNVQKEKEALKAENELLIKEKDSLKLDKEVNEPIDASTCCT